jgi:hypothetical protein
MDEQMRQQLLTTLLTWNGNGPGASALESLLLDRLDHVEPTTRTLLQQYLSRQQGEDVDDEAAADDEDFAAALDDSTVRSERKQSLSQLQHLVETMYDELEELRQRNDELADALGACYLCWGEDPACEVCQGRGSPGAMRPNKEQFTRYVAPALRRFQRKEAGQKKQPPSNNG